MQVRHVGLATFFLLPAAIGGAWAADPAAYLAARDRANAIEQKAQAASVAPSKAEEARLWAAIEAQLRLLVGSQPPNGFSGKATMSPEKLLYGDIGAGALDGFSYRATDGAGSVWLRPRVCCGAGSNAPRLTTPMRSFQLTRSRRCKPTISTLGRSKSTIRS